MGSKFVMYFFLFVGGTAGGYIPMLWHDSVFSLWSILLSGVGGVVGVWVGFKINGMIGG